jgi:ketosteroid isomerase-like protein
LPHARLASEAAVLDTQPVIPEQSTTPDLVELTRRRVDAADSGDIDAMTSFLAQEAVWDSSPMGLEVYEGRAAIHSGLEDWWGAFDVSGAEAEEILDLGNGVTFASSP